MALVKWERLTRPNKEEGWGIRNTFHFSKALVAKRLWNVIVGFGLWRDALVQKYIYFLLVLDWIRK